MICRKCKIEKDIEKDFYKTSTLCKECHKIYNSKRYKENNGIAGNIWDYFEEGTEQYIHDYVQKEVIPFMDAFIADKNKRRKT